jgi:hypothetical protein
VRDVPAFAGIVRRTTRQSLDSTTRALVSRIAFASGTLLEGESLFSAHTDNAELCRTQVKKCVFNETKLTSIAVRDVIATEWEFVRCTLASSTVAKTRFLNCNATLTCNACEFDDVAIMAGKWTLFGKNWAIRSSTISGGQFEMGGRGVVIDTAFCDLPRVVISLGAELAASSVFQVVSSRVECNAVDRWYGQGAKLTFRDSLLIAFWVHVGDLPQSSAPGAQPHPAEMTLERCRGVVVVEMDMTTSKPERSDLLRDLGARYSPIHFFEASSLRLEAHRVGELYKARSPDGDRHFVAFARSKASKQSSLEDFIDRLGEHGVTQDETAACHSRLANIGLAQRAESRPTKDG